MKNDLYNLVDLGGKIPEGEPVFLLRGQDVSAPKVIRFWAQEQRVRGGDQALANSAEQVAEQMEHYQKATGAGKLADGPKPGQAVTIAPPTVPEFQKQRLSEIQEQINALNQQRKNEEDGLLSLQKERDSLTALITAQRADLAKLTETVANATKPALGDTFNAAASLAAAAESSTSPQPSGNS